MPDPPRNRASWIRAALDQYQRSLTRYAQHFTGDLDRARDVVQETFLKLCRSDPAELSDHLGPWLFTVCRNQALSLQRKERPMQPLSDTDEERFPSPLPSPADDLEQADDKHRIQQIIQSLKPKQQEVIRLKFQEGLSYREISQITGLSVSNVGFVLHTALKIIRRKLGTGVPAPATIRRVK